MIEICRILFAAALLPLLISCGGGSSATVLTYDAFSMPEQVVIIGYNGDIMEPFISCDDRYLFFNNASGGATDKDIYYASHDILSDKFTFAGAIANLNTPAVEGVPTLDASNHFYYISTYNYPPGGAAIFDTIYTGDFDPASVDIVGNLKVVQNLDEETPGHLNFDVEVSPDGSSLYFVDGIFSGNPFPDVSNFAYATGSGNTFSRATDSDTVFANINTADLEYAACISADGKEFFFTRLNLDTLQTGIYRSIRPDAVAPFEPPRKVSAISGFVEAPTLSMDEKRLYYHRLNSASGKFELYRVTRP